MSGTSLTPDEVRAAAETHSELGPDYSSAVIESFIDKVGKEIDARVDARVAMGRPAAGPMTPYQAQPLAPAPSSGRGTAFALAVSSMVIGIPLTAIEAAYHFGIPGLIVIWIALTAINVAYGLHNRPLGRGR
ncbi:MAG TPA: hypothetical protein VMR14_11440 [Streptosporangiaceae bacterium]|nr:hypothetical protein [Streptosporangiaceae bacterium]